MIPPSFPEQVIEADLPPRTPMRLSIDALMALFRWSSQDRLIAHSQTLSVPSYTPVYTCLLGICMEEKSATKNTRAYYFDNLKGVQRLPHDSGMEVSHEVLRSGSIGVMHLDNNIPIDTDSRGQEITERDLSLSAKQVHASKMKKFDTWLGVHSWYLVAKPVCASELRAVGTAFQYHWMGKMRLAIWLSCGFCSRR
ncbi:hypothetical protein EDB19DRAFT_1828428 [Suillus lakei]|nr:hypothetical protein EDB19DRAFT_1828428 [Suillus lakei]